MIKFAPLKLAASLAAVSLVATAALGQAVSTEKKAESALTTFKPFGEVQLRLFNKYSREGSGAYGDADSFQLFRPLVGTEVLNGNASVSLRTVVMKHANDNTFSQLQPILNLTVNNLTYGPLTVTPYVEHYFDGKGWNPETREYTAAEANTEVYLDNLLLTAVPVSYGTFTFQGEVELMASRTNTPGKLGVNDRNGFALADMTTKANGTDVGVFSHEWNVGGSFSPAALPKLTVGVYQYLTNYYELQPYTMQDDGTLDDTARYGRYSNAFEQLALTYKVNEKFKVVNYLDFKRAEYAGLYATGTRKIENQTRLVYSF